MARLTLGVWPFVFLEKVRQMMRYGVGVYFCFDIFVYLYSFLCLGLREAIGRPWGCPGDHLGVTWAHSGHLGGAMGQHENRY